MIVKYIGHACFKVTDAETEYSVVIDPYEGGYIPGLENVNEDANLVLCSHGHGDHNAEDQVAVISAPIESPFAITEINCWHDDQHGAARGANIIRILDNGARIIHYGDLGENIDDFLTDERMNLLKGADIALIPVGGTYTITEDQALDLIEKTQPAIAIPMHFRSDACGFGIPGISTIESFAEKAMDRGMAVCMGGSQFDSVNDAVCPGVLIMKPAAC